MMPPKPMPQQMGPRPMMPPKPMPQQPAPQQQQPAGEDPFATNPQQRMFYQNLFLQLDKDKDHKISHDDVIAYHAQSGLPKEVLERLYGMSDLDRDGSLDFPEFVIMTHILFTCRRGIPLPERLPASLIPPSKAGLMNSKPEPEVEEEEEEEEEEEVGNEEGFYEPSDDNDCCEEEGCHCHDDDCHCHEDGCHCHDDE